jgi:hypothetical protein
VLLEYRPRSGDGLVVGASRLSRGEQSNCQSRDDCKSHVVLQKAWASNPKSEARSVEPAKPDNPKQIQNPKRQIQNGRMPFSFRAFPFEF